MVTIINVEKTKKLQDKKRVVNLIEFHGPPTQFLYQHSNSGSIPIRVPIKNPFLKKR
jgi:hypothetical protein